MKTLNNYSKKNMKKKILLYFILLCINVSAQNAIINDTIPLTINEQNTIFVKVIFNEIDTLNLNFDTGTTELILTNNVLKNKLKSTPKLYNTFYNLKIGNTIYETKVYDAELTGHGTDGRFGWNFFKDKIVEINYDENILIVHSILPENVKKDKKYTKLSIEFYEDLFLVESEIKQCGVSNKELFLFDTGYQRTVMLDDDLLKQGGFPTEKMEVIKEVLMKGAQGNEIPIITSNLKILKIGKYKLKNVPVQQITTNKPLKNKSIHILGNEVLKRFNLFLDFQNNFVYIAPNHLFNKKYIDEKNGI
jgi:hypothetical protein